uniref:ATP synthase complex subunit 8 n=1 Tax=Ochthebius puncticollis TaxID=1309305 RepID=A0A7H0DJX9_9COLE|nr:ATP synthase F0 subunit 8 [Ochthebius puncticollis]QNP09639.1 ATP synthase F0 subunit 8 [Ochthebius puncticollis]
MPQMAPMNWLILFMNFTMIFLMFNSINYFSFKYEIMKNKNNMKIIKLINWKW